MNNDEDEDVYTPQHNDTATQSGKSLLSPTTHQRPSINTNHLTQIPASEGIRAIRYEVLQQKAKFATQVFDKNIANTSQNAPTTHNATPQHTTPCQTTTPHHIAHHHCPSAFAQENIDVQTPGDKDAGYPTSNGSTVDSLNTNNPTPQSGVLYTTKCYSTTTHHTTKVTPDHSTHHHSTPVHTTRFTTQRTTPNHHPKPQTRSLSHSLTLHRTMAQTTLLEQSLATRASATQPPTATRAIAPMPTT